MSRLSIVLLAVAAACGGKSNPATPVAPLPADPEPAAAQTAEAPAPEPAPAPAPPPPLEEAIEPVAVDVKVLNRGKGKREPLVYASAPGNKQQVELALDFAASQKAAAELGGDQDQKLPTVVLVGDAETKNVGADGSTEYVFTVTGTDARAVAGSPMPLDQLKQALTGLKGLTIQGTRGANGAQVGPITLRLEKPDPMSAQLIEMVRATLPSWPALPTEPVGTGAKWRATSKTTIMGQIPIEVVTDYQLASRKGASWTIKGTTKVVGEDQELKGSKISKIGGKGTTEATLDSGAVFPKLTSSLETKFTATEGDQTMTLAVQVGSSVTPAPAATASN